jgi:hypothetical protein
VKSFALTVRSAWGRAKAVEDEQLEDAFGDWAPVSVGALGSVMCPPGWELEGAAQDDAGVALKAPDSSARLVVHAVIHNALEADTDFAGRMQAAAERVMAHMIVKAGASEPEVNTIEGAAQPILEIASEFFEDPEKPTVKVRQAHALAPLDAGAARIGVIAFSLMTPALLPEAASAEIAAGFRQSLRAAAAALAAHSG